MTLQAELESTYLPEDGALGPAVDLIPVEEWAEIDIPLDKLVVDGRVVVYDEIQGKGYFDVRLGSSGNLRVTAGGAIGFIPLNPNVTLHVRPRVDIEQIAHVLTVAEGSVIPLERLIRGYDPAERAPESIVEAMVRAFVDGCRDIERFGLYREYVARTQSTSFPKGRTHFGRTVAVHRSRGEQHRLAARWFEQTADNGANRLLRYVVHWLYPRFRRTRGQAARNTLRELNELDHILSSAQIDHGLTFLRDPIVEDPDRLPVDRAYYSRPVRLAKALLWRQGLEFESGRRMDLESLVIDMSDVFERYVRAVLTRGLAVTAPDLRVLDGNVDPGRGTVFDQNPNVDATPDIVVTAEDMSVPVVVEVKYKKLKSAFALPDRDDINQTVTYGAAYRAAHVILLHPRQRGGRVGNYQSNTIGALGFRFYSFDLGAPPQEEAARLVEFVVDLAANSATDSFFEASTPTRSGRARTQRVGRRTHGRFS